MIFFKLPSFDFSLRETLTLLALLIKTIQCKLENGIGKYHLRNFRQSQHPPVINFHEWQYWISSSHRRPKKILSTTNKFLNNGLLLYLYVKNKCKIVRKHFSEMGHVDLLWIYGKLCQYPKPKWSFPMVSLKQQRTWVCTFLETIKTNKLKLPLSNFKWYEVSSSWPIIF